MDHVSQSGPEDSLTPELFFALIPEFTTQLSVKFFPDVHVSQS